MKLEPMYIKVKIEGTDVGTKIMPLYKEGKSIEEIAKVFSIKNHHKLIIAINEYILKNKLKIQKERVNAINPEDIFRLKKEGHTSVKIGTMYNISRFEVDSIFDKYCRENNISKKEFINKEIEENINKDELIKDLKNGYSLKELAKKYKIGQTKVRQIIAQNLFSEEIRSIFAKNRNKQYLGEEIAFKILELYREGNTRVQIAEIIKETEKIECDAPMVNKVLIIQYNKMGRSKVPKIIGRSVFFRIVKKKNYTREEIIEEADKLNFIIPKKYLDEYFEVEEVNKENPEELKKRDIDIKKIRNFVISKFADNEVEEENRKKMFNNFNIAKILKESEYDSMHQALALLYSLPQITNTTEEEIFNLLDNNEGMVQALKIIWDDTSNEEEYIEKLKKCQLAKCVKLAILIEKMRETTINEEKIDMSKYEKYKQLVKGTRLKVEYDLAIMENNQLCFNERSK